MISHSKKFKITREMKIEAVEHANAIEKIFTGTPYVAAWTIHVFKSRQKYGYPKFKEQPFWGYLIDIFQGLYSGYPLCCIWFFVFKTNKQSQYSKICKSRSKYRIYHKLMYVPCEKCFNRFLKEDNYAQKTT